MNDENQKEPPQAYTDYSISIRQADYHLLMTLLSDELVTDINNETLNDMLLTLQARLVDARRWRQALEITRDRLQTVDILFDVRLLVAEQHRAMVDAIDAALDAKEKGGE